MKKIIRGFTLVELIVALAVSTILLAGLTGYVYFVASIRGTATTSNDTATHLSEARNYLSARIKENDGSTWWTYSDSTSSSFSWSGLNLESDQVFMFIALASDRQTMRELAYDQTDHCFLYWHGTYFGTGPYYDPDKDTTVTADYYRWDSLKPDVFPMAGDVSLATNSNGIPLIHWYSNTGSADDAYTDHYGQNYSGTACAAQVTLNYGDSASPSTYSFLISMEAY